MQAMMNLMMYGYKQASRQTISAFLPGIADASPKP